METKMNNIFIQELRHEPYFPVECGVTNMENQGMLKFKIAEIQGKQAF